MEWFDRKTLRHAASHSLGLRDEGSLVWVIPQDDGWSTGFVVDEKHKSLEIRGIIREDCIQRFHVRGIREGFAAALAAAPADALVVATLGRSMIQLR